MDQKEREVTSERNEPSGVPKDALDGDQSPEQIEDSKTKAHI